MIDEYQRRLAMATSQAGLETERKTVALALKRANAQENRITDAFINEAMELDRYKAEMDKLGQRRMALERAEQEIDQLRGVIRCPPCGATYTGAVQHGYRRYRCTQTDPAVSSTGKWCPP